jgi:hypothetical protein
MSTKLAKQLLKIRQRNLLPLTDGRKGDRPIVLAQGQIDHGGDSKTTFGGETHKNSSE